MTRKVTERTKTRSYRRSARHMISICLALVMFLGSAFAYDTAIAFQAQQSSVIEGETFDEWGLSEEGDLSNFQINYATNLSERTSYEEMGLRSEMFFDENISENRRNYMKLLEGRYNNYQLRQRFVELFGSGFSGEYIFNNYRTLFDLNEHEIIDSAFLRVLSGYRVDFRFQDANDISAFGRTSGDERVRIFPDSDMSARSELTSQDFELENLFLEQIMENMLVTEISDYSEAFDLQHYDMQMLYYDGVQIHSDFDLQAIEPFSSDLVRMNLWSRTDTSITVDLWFANNTWANNNLQIWEPGTSSWRWIFPRDGRSGRHVITGLSPGVTYYIVASTGVVATQGWVHAEMFVTTTLPPPHLILHQRSSVDFRLDRTFTDALGVSLTNSFLDANNQAFYSIRTLIGGPQFYSGGRMQIDHVRNLYWQMEGISGWPIRWQLTNVHGGWGALALDHAQRMRTTGIETTEIPIHEIGHNFDNFRWSFEPEAIAILFTYYYYATTGRRMAVAGQSRTFRGSEFRTYMRSYANRTFGKINHQDAMWWGIYSPYSMAYVLGSIAGQIGWQPFTNTFIHFNSLEPYQVPQTDLGKLNLFLSMLSHYSGRDVFAMIPANARRIYDLYFGGWIGAIRYVPVPEINTIISPYHNQRVPWRDLVVTWRTIPDATHNIWLFNRTENRYIIYNRRSGTFNWYTIRQEFLTPTHQYRVRVDTTFGGRTTTRTRDFSVQDHIITPTGVTISPAGILHLVVGGQQQLLATVTPDGANQAVRWTSDRPLIAAVDSLGMVRAHSQGTARITATTVCGARSASIYVDVREVSDAYLALGIGWPLGDRNGAVTVRGNSRFVAENRDVNRIGVHGSNFGALRERIFYHLGLDITDPARLARDRSIVGNPVIAVADGVVDRVSPTSGGGQGFSISFISNIRDPITGEYLIFTHHHLQSRPRRGADGPNLARYHNITRGEIIGFAGNTGTIHGYGHLHFEVSNYRGDDGTEWSWGPLRDSNDNRLSIGSARWRWYAIDYRVNPRFFFADDAFGGYKYIWNGVKSIPRP